MLRLSHITKPFNTLQRFRSIALGARYRLFSSNVGSINGADYGKYRVTDTEGQKLNSIILLAKSSKFDEFFQMLKEDPAMNSLLMFNQMLQQSYGKSTLGELEIKERIADIMQTRCINPDASSLVPLLSLNQKVNNVEKVDAIFQNMKDADIKRNSAVYAILLRVHELDLNKIEALWKDMIVDEIKPHNDAFLAMLTAQIKGGMMRFWS
jgi:hypothetical protein